MMLEKDMSVTTLHSILRWVPNVLDSGHQFDNLLPQCLTIFNLQTTMFDNPQVIKFPPNSFTSSSDPSQTHTN